jgi:hypothetical protein
MLTMLMEETTKDMYVCQSARKRMLLRTRTNRSIIIIQGVNIEENQKIDSEKISHFYNCYS